MQHETVQYDGNNYHFPINFARKRTKKDIWDKFLLSGVFTGVGCWLSPLPWFEYLITSNAYCYCFYFSFEVLSRLTSFREEYSHLESRYEGKIIFLLKKLFSFNATTVCFLSFSILVITIREIIGALITKENIWEYITVGGIYPWLCSLAAMKLFVDNIQMDESTIKMAKLIDRINGLDYGSGMAISFFYGYLNIILPSTGTTLKGLREHILEFASEHGVTFASNKLYILMPKSGKCPPKVCDYSPRHILEQCRHMEAIKINRGGQNDRTYHTTVYKLHTVENGKKVVRYVCAEFASALQTFYEVTENAHFLTSFCQEHSKEIITNFYMTLHRFLLEKNFSHLCEIIYFEDRDANNQIYYEDRRDIGDLLLQKLGLPSSYL